MSKLPSLTGKDVVAALASEGGSHHFLRHQDGRTTVVPVHAGETSRTGLMSELLRDCDLSREEFRRLL